MAKNKITIELDDEIFSKIKEMYSKFNDNPLFNKKFSSIEDYISYVITTQIKSADAFQEKMGDGFKKIFEKMGNFNLDDIDFSDLFGGNKSKKTESESPKKPEKIKN